MSENNKINKWVTKHRFLIEAGYSMTLTEQRVIMAGLSQIDTRDDDTHASKHTATSLKDLEFIIDAEDFSDQFSLPLDNTYKELKAACKRLADNAITIYDPEAKDGFDYLRSTFGSFEWSSEHRKIRITWHPKMFPYICQLKGQFGSYMLSAVKGFTSQYSIRLFEYLIQWQSLGFKEVKIEWLRERFQLGKKHKLTGDLKRWVIEPAIADINEHSNLWVKMGVRKRDNKIIAFQFKFGPKEKKETKPKKIELGPMVDGVPEKILNRLARPGQTTNDAAKYVKSLRQPKESWADFDKRMA